MAGNTLTGLKRGPAGGNDSVASITPIANIATLTALTLTGNPDNCLFVYVDCYATPSDGGGGFFEYSASSSTAIDNSTTFASAMGGRWLRVWDGFHFKAAWAGMFAGTTVAPGTDVSALFGRLPIRCKIEYDPGIYQVANPVSQGDFSERFHRGRGTFFQVTYVFTTQFDPTQIQFNWSTVEPPLTFFNYSGGASGDSYQAGVSPIEGIGILGADANAGTGLALGEVTSGQSQVRGTSSHSTGKWMYEFQLTSIPGENFSNAIGVGIAPSTHPLTTILGSDLSLQVANVGVYAAYNAGGGLLGATSNGWFTNDWIAVCVDFDARLIWVRNNRSGNFWNTNVSADPATGVGGYSIAILPNATSYFPCVMLLQQNYSVLMNFGASAFATALPSGFSAWGSSTTLNPSDNFGVTLSAGNLGATNNNQSLTSTYPRNYFMRPRALNMGGFYANVGYVTTDHCFLTGFDESSCKGGSIGVYYVKGNDSGENMSFAKNYFGNLGTDGAQFFNLQRATFDDSSFDYNHRNFYLSNASTAFKNVYFETNVTATPGVWGSLDGGAVVNFDASTSILLIPPFNGSPGPFTSDLISFEAGSGGYSQAYFDGTKYYQAAQGTTPSGRIFAIDTAGKNAFGYFVGFNGNNFPDCLSPNQLLNPDWNFANGGLTFYPGSTHASVGTINGRVAAQLTFAGTSTLQTVQWEVRAGDLIFIQFDDYVAGGTGFTSFAGSQANFLTSDGIVVSTPAFSRAPGVVGFTPGGAELAPVWGNGGGHDWTRERMVFRVPVGASKMSLTFSATGSSGAIYAVSPIAVYNNSGR